MPMRAEDIESFIKQALPDAEVSIRDLAGDGDHYAATVISEAFRGKTRVQQHQMVYDALRGQYGRHTARPRSADLRSGEVTRALPPVSARPASGAVLRWKEAPDQTPPSALGQSPTSG